nr:bifunctional DNA primase/polymerase [uncultured Mediterranean phage uvMED]BAR22925.1 bifunctional DNA primase/polymerase [uncultured Mediterranean phage uvMED]BAR39146.1 bifunctional DNA primase/polymerase [uncultured Mediterranean phage uvMED]
MNLADFTRTLPKNWATAPIYAQGFRLPGDKGGVACGKSPLGRAHRENLSPHASARYIEQHPDTYKAIGVFTGPRSDGLVILDVDANLASLKRKWGATLKEAPVVVSPKKNAAKYLFRVPKEKWGQVAGISLAASKQGWEVLWGIRRQGLVGGAYYQGGEYKLSGDVNAIPEAPEWLLVEMEESFKKRQEGTSGAQRKDLRYSCRSREEKIAIAENCLSVIPPQGRGSDDFWWRIGAMLHSEMPDEDGLNIWRQWSQKDEEYSDDWKNGDPCADRWEAGFKADGGLGFGSLMHLANHYDPEKARFQGNNLASVVAEIETAPIRYRQETLSYDEAMKQMKEAMDIENPGRRNYEINRIKNEAGYKDQSKLEGVYVDHIGYIEDTGGFTLDELKSKVEKRDFLIPDVMATPAVVVIYAEGGKGKSTAAWTLAKHVVTGSPFVVRGKHAPVAKGGCVILNGDQPLADLDDQLDEVEFPRTKDVHIEPNWNLGNYAQFQNLLKKRKPKLVIIDSLIGCSGGRAFDENKSDFATPLYWLTRNNGTLFPRTTILIIHHANKQGGFRGTSAIRDAVTETWRLAEPTDKQIEQGIAPRHSRIIHVEKSRSGRSGTALIMRQESDLTFSIADFTAEIDSTDTSPSGITDRVLSRVRAIYPRSISRTELNADPIVGGNVTAIRKALQRWVGRGLITTHEAAVPGQKGGKAPLLYTAVVEQPPHTRVRGEVEDSVPLGEKPCDDAVFAMGQAMGQQPKSEEVSHSPESNGTVSEKEAGCPIAKASDTKGSAPMGQSDQYPRARRSFAEIDQLMREAGSKWD